MNENICPFLEINKTTYGAWCQVTFPPCPYISRTETHRTNVELNERCCHLSDSAYTDVKNLVAKLKTLHQPTEIEVINLHTCKDFGTREGDVLCDRRTKWGNPFKMNKESERD